MSKKILFIVPYPIGQAGSQRFRFEQYFDILKNNGFEIATSPFLDEQTWRILYKPGHAFQKISGLIKGYLRRIKDVFRVKSFDYIFIHREASPFGPPVFEWLLMRWSKRKSVFDLDDAIWMTNASESNWLLRHLKRNRNADDCCRWATVVSAGNNYLADHALKFNNKVVVNPTVVDTDKVFTVSKDSFSNDKLIVGWTGSHSTLFYLNDLYPVFSELEKQFSFQLNVICDVPPKWNLKSLNFIVWNKKDEIEELLKFDIGVMPLADNEWAKGKCGFKAIQYLALGIPALVSDVGVSPEIIDHGVNGYICRTLKDWEKYLAVVLSTPSEIEKLRQHTREKIVSRYSVVANKEKFLSLFTM